MRVHRVRLAVLISAIVCALAAPVIAAPGAASSPPGAPKETTRIGADRVVADVLDRLSALVPLGDRTQFGAYVVGAQADPSRLTAFETLIDERVDIASIYWGYGDVFPGATELALADGGTRKVLASWDMGPTRFASWTRGAHDDYLRSIVAAARAYPYVLYIRPWPEMNGDWQPFQPTPDGSKPYGGTYAQFKEAWRYVVDFFRARSVTNLRWVFNPTADTYAETTPVDKIWPGTGYVQVLGLDGFNWGKDNSWGRWQNFESIFRTQYGRLVALDPWDPVWVCEVASKEPTIYDGSPIDPYHDKGSWVRTMLSSDEFPRMRALLWFHERKERDWRVNSSPSSLQAFRDRL